MDWNDLPIEPESLARLRREFGFGRPQEVVRLAWGADELLRRVIGEDEIGRIKERYSFDDSLPYDSSGFKLGARPGSPTAFGLSKTDGFVEQRTSLLDELERATSPARRATLENKLKRLYQTG